MTIQEVLDRHAAYLAQEGTLITFRYLVHALEGYCGPDAYGPSEEWCKILAATTLPAVEKYLRALPPEQNPVQVLAKFMDRFPDLPGVLDSNIRFCQGMKER